MQAKLGLVIALASEARAVVGRTPPDSRAFLNLRLPDGTQLVAAVAGIGTQRAAAAAGELVSQGVNALVSVGLAGGLDPRLRAGHIVVASDVLRSDTGRLAGPWKCDAGGIALARDTFEAAGVRFDCGTLLTTDQAVLTCRHKASLFEQTRALAADMESAAVAGVAQRASMAFFGMRAVCDPADCRVAPELFQCLDANGRIRAAHLVRSLIRKPALIGRMFYMGRAFSVARKSLANAWQVLLDKQLPLKLTGAL